MHRFEYAFLGIILFYGVNIRKIMPKTNKKNLIIKQFLHPNPETDFCMEDYFFEQRYFYKILHY